MFKFKVRIWLENKGEFLMSAGRAELLKHIDETGSLARAAERMGFSYRHAWGILKKISAAAGAPVVKSERGGTGGKTTLTAQGRKVLDVYVRGLERAKKALRSKDFVIDG